MGGGGGRGCTSQQVGLDGDTYSLLDCQLQVSGSRRVDQLHQTVWQDEAVGGLLFLTVYLGPDGELAATLTQHRAQEQWMQIGGEGSLLSKISLQG